MEHSHEAELYGLMTLAQKGDSASYRALLQKSGDLVLQYQRRALERLGLANEASAEDLVQETLIAIHSKRATFDPSQLFTPWLFAIARYKLIDYGRRSKNREHWNQIEEVVDFVAMPEQEDPSTSGDLEKLFQELPEKQREVLKLVKLEGLSVIEASKKMGMSVSAIKVTIHRAIKKLKLEMAK